MALGASIYKAELDISNLDRNYYANRILTVARHSSETEGRMMLRLLCYCLWDSDTIRFADGLSKEGEPALADTDDTGWISLWVELGVPTVKQLPRGCHGLRRRSDQSLVGILPRRPGKDREAFYLQCDRRGI